MKHSRFTVARCCVLMVAVCVAVGAAEQTAESPSRDLLDAARRAAAELDFVVAEDKLLLALESLREDGGDVRDTGAVLEELARVYRDTGRRQLAKQMLQRSLELKRSELGGDDPELADTFEELAALAAGDGERAEAEKFLLEALRIRRREPAIDRRELAETLVSIGFFYESGGRLEEARVRLQEAVDVAESTDEVTLTLFNALVGLQEVAERQGRSGEVACLQERVEQVWKEIEMRPELLRETEKP